MQVERAPPRPAGGHDEGDTRIAKIESADDLGTERLRLQRHHPRAEPTEGADAVADVAADVEGEAAIPTKRRYKSSMARSRAGSP